MQLRSASANEVDAFVDLLEDAAAWMRERGIDQWRPGSMRAQRAAFVAAQSRGEILVLEQAGRIVGGAVLRSEPDPIWADLPVAGALYVSKLVVARDATGKNLGARILDDLEAIARSARSDVDTARLCRLERIVGALLPATRLLPARQRAQRRRRSVASRQTVAGASRAWRSARWTTSTSRAGNPIASRRCCSWCGAGKCC